MPTNLELDVPMLPPTPNQLRGSHWSKKKRIRDEAGWAVKKSMEVEPGVKWSILNFTPSRRVTIDVVVHAHGRAADSDNQWARIKPIIDAIVSERLLVDDSPEWLTLGTITHAKAPPKKGHVVVRLTYHEKVAA